MQLAWSLSRGCHRGASLSCGSKTIVQSGDTCFQLWSSNDLTEQQFATLNPTVYPSCGSSLQTGVSVCLGNQLPTSATCGSTYVVLPGDYCYRIWTSAGLTQDAFLALNPNINCTDLPINWVVCTSSPGSSSSAASTSDSSVPVATGGSTSVSSFISGPTASTVLSQLGQVSNTTQLLQNFVQNYGVPPGQSSQVSSGLLSQFTTATSTLHTLLTGLGTDASLYGFTPYLLYNSSQLSSLLGATPPSSATSRRMRSLLQSSSSTNPYTNSKVPQRIDFRSLQIGTKTYNYMSAVKNQEQCGDCWAFASTEGVEAINTLAGNGAQTLSPQQMLDCVSSSPTQDSCSGGWPDQALQWAVKTGQTSDASYPYKVAKGSCSAQKAAVNIDGYVTLADSLNGVAGNTVTLLKAVSNQPVVATMRAETSFESYYQGGSVWKQSGCTSNTINHAILIVGFDVGKCSKTLSNGNPDVTSQCTGGYWICRNSWGTGWGSGGYFLMDMWGEGQAKFDPTQGTCGLIENTWFPLLKKYSGLNN
ncbi:hypothetical protein WJX82_007309 [Trebouxia sp. C0006]